MSLLIYSKINCLFFIAISGGATTKPYHPFFWKFQTIFVIAAFLNFELHIALLFCILCVKEIHYIVVLLLIYSKKSFSCATVWNFVSAAPKMWYTPLLFFFGKGLDRVRPGPTIWMLGYILDPFGPRPGPGPYRTPPRPCTLKTYSRNLNVQFWTNATLINLLFIINIV